MKIPGVYVTIAGDITQLKADMTQAQRIVKDSATGMSNAMGNALSPQQLQRGVNSLVRNLGTVQRSTKVTGKDFDNLSVDLGEFRKVTGLAEKDLSKLQGRLLQTKAAAATDRALIDIARSAGLSATETAVLRLKLGDTTGALRDFKRIGVGAFQSVHNRVFNLRNAIAGMGLGLVVASMVREFSELDSGLIGVKKTTGITGDELHALGEDIQEISKTSPLATKELLAIAQSAGQLGVTGRSNILKFVKTVGMLGSASDLAGEEAATSLARILNVTGESADNVEVLGSVIVALGNNMAATESEIAHMATEVAQATGVFGVSSSEAAALGATLKSLGIRAELGGSSVGRAFRAIDKAIRGGGDSMQELMLITGMTDRQLRQTFKTNSTEVFQAFIKGLGQMIGEGDSAAEVLGRFGLKGEEVLKSLPVLAKRSDELARALNIANEETENATALTLEAMEAWKAFEAQMDRDRNIIRATAADIGEELAPAILEVSSAFAQWVSENKGQFSEFAGESIEFVRHMAPLAGKVGEIFSSTVTGWNKLPTVVQEIGIVGALVGGAKARIAITLIAAAMGQIDKLNKQAAGITNIDKSSAILNQELVFLNNRQEALNDLRGQDVDIFGPEIKKQIEDSQNRIKALQDRIAQARIQAEQDFRLIDAKTVAMEEAKKEVMTTGGIGGSGEDEDIKKKCLRSWEDFERDLTVITAEQSEKREARIEAEFDKRRDQLKAYLDAGKITQADYDKWFLALNEGETKALEEEWKKRGKKQTEIDKKNLEQAKKIDGRYFEEEKLKLNKKETLLKKSSKNSIKIEAWASRERDKIAEDELENKLLFADDFFDYSKARATLLTKTYRSEHGRQLELWEAHYDALADVSEGAFDGMGDSTSDFFFDVMGGDLRDFEDYWESSWTGMRRVMADSLADMAGAWVKNGITSFGADMLGSMGGFFGDIIDAVFHSGAEDVGPDELLAKLQAGEMVVPRGHATRIRKAMASQGGMSGGGQDFFDGLTSSVESGNHVDTPFNASMPSTDVHDLLSMQGMISGLRGIQAAYGTYSNYMSAGKSLEAYGVDQSAVESMAREASFEAFTKTMMTSFVGGFGQKMVSHAMGVSDYDNYGSALSSAALAALGISIPGLGLAFSPIASFGISKVMDLFDARKNERVKDFFEDTYDEFTGQSKFQGFMDYMRGFGVTEGNISRLGNSSIMAMHSIAGDDILVDLDRIMNGQVGLFGDGKWDVQGLTPGGKEIYDALAGYLGPQQTSGGSVWAGGGEAGSAISNNGLGGMSGWSGGGPSDTGPGNGNAYAHTGGYLTKSLKHDEGNITVQTGEAVVSRPGMEILNKINNGEFPEFGGSGPMTVIIQVAGHDVAEAIIPDLRNASENGTIVLHGSGVA
ncbi:MAG: phage tail tape measure protein [Pseudodesulfovibrio sp.]|nr:phage tail tape measure protein [Pseudodesulfovibrio sp.]